MSTVRTMLVVLATVLAIAAPRPALAQQTDPFVSCVRCHALPMQQATAALGDHGYGYGYPPQPPEMVCDNCHNTWSQSHEQNPSSTSVQPYFWWRSLGYDDSTMKELCLSCHTTFEQHVWRATNDVSNHPNDVFPFFDGTPPLTKQLIAPKSVLPLYDYYTGSPNQFPYAGGLVCSTCHDPHDPSYAVNGSPKFLRIGMPEITTRLCDTCHLPTLPGMPDLFISSRSDSVRFQKQTDGTLKIDVKVKNRGNYYSSSGGLNTITVTWYSATGILTTVGSFALPTIQPDVEVTVPLLWMPPSGWTGWTDGGFFVFRLPSSPLKFNPLYQYNEYVRAMNILPAPANLTIYNVASDMIHLVWAPPPGAGSLTYDVYRDGVKVNPLPITEPSYVDYGLAPETPHVYTVTAVQGDLTSAQSDPVGATTTVGYVIRVPQDRPTIQEAIDAADFGTSIHVAAGTYTEQLSFWNKYGGITVKGQDANGCILEAPLPLGPPIILRSSGSGIGSGITLSGFTIKNQSVDMGEGDVLAYSVLQGQTSTFVADGGLVAQCVFDTPGPAVFIGPGKFFAAVNSIFRSTDPLQKYDATSSGLLLNNNFPAWTGWSVYQGSGNFEGIPQFEPPGPPDRYFTEISSITTAKGLELESWLYGPPPGPMPDVGAFSGSQPYTPKPPSNLNASWQTAGTLRVRLTWTLSPDDAMRTMAYYIYRSDMPYFPPGSESTPYMQAAPGMNFFDDLGAQPGVIYYYQVRAFGGPTGPYGDPLLSAPTNIAQTEDINVPPVAVNDFPSVLEDQSVIISVLANDSDANMDPLTVAAVTSPLHGTVVRSPDNTLVAYMPVHDFFGTDTFTYTVSDGRGGLATAQVTVTVTPVNDAPVAVNDGYPALEDTALVVGTTGVLVNDTDVDSVTRSAVLVTGPAHGALILNSAGSFTYTPAANYSGQDSFTYRASDGQAQSNVATVTITVTPINDPPLAVNDGYPALEDTALVVGAPGVLGNDTDIDSVTLSAVLFTGPAHGALILNSAGSFTYTPAANYSGPDSFTYRASDGQATSNVATVSITVTAVNDKPVANSQPLPVIEDIPRVVILTATDIDNDPLTYRVTSSPAHGALSGTAPNLTYTPASNSTVGDSFTFVANDGTVDSDPATVTITVMAVNDKPEANSQTLPVTEDTPTAVTLAATDADGDSLTYRVTGGPAHGALSGSAPNLTYTPALNSTAGDSFTFVANDGTVDSDPATVTIAMTAVNDRPVADDKQVPTNEDTDVAITLTATDADGDLLTYTVKTVPTKGTLTGTAPNLAYKPTANDSGVYSFTFVANDGILDSNVATVMITVTAVNDAPVAANDGTYNTLEDTNLTVAAPGVLGNDTDIDSVTLSAALATGPAHGTLTLNPAGSFTYTPAANYNGPDSFTYRASDGQATSNVATVSIAVTAVNDAPVANAGPDKRVKVNSSTTFNGAGSADVDGTIVSYSWNFGDGTTATGMTVTKKYKKAGAFTVTLTVKDNLGATGTDTALITVTK